MPAIILPLTFAAFFLALFSRGNRGVRSTFVEAVILFSLAAVLITESLSAVRRIEFESVLLSWMIALLAAVAIAIRRADVLKDRMISVYLDAASWIGKSNGLRKWTVFSIMGLTLLLLIQGLVYPSNSTDTLMYHLPRTVSWIGQRSVELYPTNHYHQVYMPPFAEYMVTFVNILSGGDRYCNTVEWFFLTACAIAVSKLTELLLPRPGYSIAAHLLVVCLPVAVLQSSTANNDIVTSFFVLTSVLYSYRWIKASLYSDSLLLGASFGLSCLTKATAYLYLGPMAAWLVADTLLKTYRTGMRPLLKGIIPVLVFSMVLAGTYSRNLELTGNLLGIDRSKPDLHVNEVFSLPVTASNMLKNLGGQMGPYPLNAIYDSAILKLHRATGLPIHTPGTHFGNREYRGAPNLPTHDSTAPNPIHTYLLMAALTWMVLRRIRFGEKSPSLIQWHAILILLQYILFALYLRWQPYLTRLLIPLQFLSVPVVCMALSHWRIPMTLKKTGLCMLVGLALLTSVFNDTRPFVSTSFTHGVSISQDRFDKFFTDRYRPLSVEMRRIKEIMDSEQLSDIGLVIDLGIPEYILFHDAYERKRRPVHLDVKNVSGRLKNSQTQVDCIVTNSMSDSIIVRYGRTYRNRTPGHGRIWIFQ
jgi:hypothetical protein